MSAEVSPKNASPVAQPSEVPPLRKLFRADPRVAGSSTSL